MFRFTIRELVLLTLVVAMGVGWWLDRGLQRTEVANMRAESEASNLKAYEATTAFRSLVQRFEAELPGSVSWTDDGRVLIRGTDNVISAYPISDE